VSEEKPKIAIVDHGLGNLYSVKHACRHVGLDATITSSKSDILNAAAVILPGVGAFGDAMVTLHRLDLVSVLREIAASSKPLIGVCLGVQLLMSESHEFGRHKGLGIIEGAVVHFDNPKEDEKVLKVPQIGWNRICKPAAKADTDQDPWMDTLLDGTRDGEYMYFVHSYIVQPQDVNVILSKSRYGHIEFCSSVQLRNVFACQFHPERSGVHGIEMYRNLARQLQRVA
jgi:imidazole glycerol-phosphate synthase subunit HisH